MSLLEVSNLRIRLQTHRGPADAVRGVSFSLARGETLGLIGESGCGKSITAMSLMGLLPESAEVGGSIRFDGQELVGRTDAQMCKLRGNRIGMVFQEPMTALNPVHTIGRQVAEPLRLHRGMGACLPQRWRDRRGSSRSRSPSPSRLSPSTDSAMARPGHTASSGAWNMRVWASLSMRPQEAWGGCVPRPR